MATDTETANRLKNIENLEHTEALLKNEHFLWLLETVFRPIRDDLRSKALSITVEPQKAEQARWQHATADKLCGEVARIYQAAFNSLHPTTPPTN